MQLLQFLGYIYLLGVCFGRITIRVSGIFAECSALCITPANAAVRRIIIGWLTTRMSMGKDGNMSRSYAAALRLRCAQERIPAVFMILPPSVK